MPIVAQSILDRKKYCPTVFEAFGEHIDVTVARCDTKTREKLFFGKESFFRVCATDFCYLWNPLIENNVSNFFNIECLGRALWYHNVGNYVR